MSDLNKPSEAETAILHVLWDKQPCTVKMIHETLSQLRDVGYTTTLKQIQRLLDKGLVSREPGPGKSYIYHAAVSEDETKGRLFERFVETAFSNSVSDLVMHALGHGHASKEEIAKIRDLLDTLDKKPDA